MQESREDGERTWEEIREWKELRSRVRGLLPKVPARSHIEVDEVDLLQVSLCLQNGHRLAAQGGSWREAASAALFEGLFRNFRVKLRPG